MPSRECHSQPGSRRYSRKLNTPSRVLSRQRKDTAIALRKGGMTLEAVGRLLGVTRERVRQITGGILPDAIKPDPSDYRCRKCQGVFACWHYCPVRPSWEKFIQSFKVNCSTGCWEWLRCVDKNGYGRLGHPGERYAHRESYTLFRGPIATGMTIDHLCRVRHCVNPYHMEVVTIGVNISRRKPPCEWNWKKPRSFSSHCVKCGSKRERYGGTLRCVQCSRMACANYYAANREKILRQSSERHRNKPGGRADHGDEARAAGHGGER